MTNHNLESRIAAIEARNNRVEADKAWETSYARRFSIIVATYVSTSIFLIVINADKPFINAIVPCLGFTLLTLSVGWVKQQWTARRITR